MEIEKKMLADIAAAQLDASWIDATLKRIASAAIRSRCDITAMQKRVVRSVMGVHRVQR